jgi:hypothetical protein
MVDGECGWFAEKTHGQMDGGNYSAGVSVMPLPMSFDDYLADVRTARKRAWRSQRLGYRFDVLDRSMYEDDIFAINTSLEVRQGRPMSPGYRQRQSFSPLPVYPCKRHAIRTYGVFAEEGTLVAYLVAHRVGELVLVSQILGHGDHLTGDVMYLLFVGMVRAQLTAGPGVVFYNRWDSGSEGLRYFKTRVGLKQTDVEWQL